ncbi:MAG: hypothetical protein NEHIOOID_01343 [Holosporales bacterium]
MINNFEKIKPQINEDIIKTLELYWNINFPKSYKNFLINFNGGIAKKKIFLFKSSNNGIVTHHWYGIRSESFFSILLAMHDKGHRFPDNFIPFCDDSFGNKMLLSVKGQDYGKVYFWDHEMETEPADYSNLTLIADSFEEFINSLKSEEEIEELMNKTK